MPLASTNARRDLESSPSRSAHARDGGECLCRDSDPVAARGIRHSQDQARHRHHAGEPFVRFLLRHVPGRGWNPDEQRRAHGVRPRSANAYLRQAVCRSCGCQRWRPACARATPPPTSTAAKWTALFDQAILARKGCADPTNPACVNTAIPDVMGYHVQSDIPNYWSYARDFVLQDHMYEPNASWSLPAHLFLVSEWSAFCTQHDNPSTCTNALQSPGEPPDFTGTNKHADLRLDGPHLPAPQRGVSWGYYVVPGHEPDCENDATVSCAPVAQNSENPRHMEPACPTSTPSRTTVSSAIFNPSTTSMQLPRSGTLPAVSWVVPSGEVSEHPPSPVSFGADLCDESDQCCHGQPRLVSSAIFLAWDDWGGFYDHVTPPAVDVNGYGCACPVSSSAPMPGQDTSITRR